MTVPAIVAAGDRRAAKDIRGESKPYLQIAGKPLVMHTVLAAKSPASAAERLPAAVQAAAQLGQSLLLLAFERWFSVLSMG